jgi:hypothetical protein
MLEEAKNQELFALDGKHDPRGAGMSIGRRIAKLNILYEDELP